MQVVRRTETWPRYPLLDSLNGDALQSSLRCPSCTSAASFGGKWQNPGWLDFVADAECLRCAGCFLPSAITAAFAVAPPPLSLAVGFFSSRVGSTLLSRLLAIVLTHLCLPLYSFRRVKRAMPRRARRQEPVVLLLFWLGKHSRPAPLLRCRRFCGASQSGGLGQTNPLLASP